MRLLAHIWHTFVSYSVGSVNQKREPSPRCSRSPSARRAPARSRAPEPSRGPVPPTARRGPRSDAEELLEDVLLLGQRGSRARRRSPRPARHRPAGGRDPTVAAVRRVLDRVGEQVRDDLGDPRRGRRSRRPASRTARASDRCFGSGRRTCRTCSASSSPTENGSRDSVRRSCSIAWTSRKSSISADSRLASRWTVPSISSRAAGSSPRVRSSSA